MNLQEPDATVSASVHLRMKKTIVEMLFKDELKNYYTFQTFLYTVENCLEAIFNDPKKAYTLAEVVHGLSHLTEDKTIAEFVLKAFDPSRLRHNPDKTPVQVIYDYYLQFYHSKFVAQLAEIIGYYKEFYEESEALESIRTIIIFVSKKSKVSPDLERGLDFDDVLRVLFENLDPELFLD